jgi:hypothetical protein
MASSDQMSHAPVGHSLISSSTLAVVLSCIVAYYIVNIVYSLTLHPLAVVPGPKLCAISRIPYWIVHMRGKDVHWMHHLHLKYGSIVRYGPMDLSCTAGEAWKDIHGHQKGKRELDIAIEMLMQPVNVSTKQHICRRNQHRRAFKA